ncbi:MAG TPA: ZIP family metal transporter [Clostridia bacterium]|nr:ZIP family metal transporter [Clostridia bacterium]
MPELFLVSTLAGLATGLGGLIACFIRKPQPFLVAIFLGFAAGVMVAVTGFDLIPSALFLGGAGRTGLGVALGLFILWLLDKIIPHHGTNGDEGRYSPERWKKIGIFIAAGIALHNFPEGLAIGAGYFAAESLGTVIALAIAFHNVPEGMATALPLRLGGMSVGGIVLVTSLAGYVTPLGTYLGTILYGISEYFISFSLAFAGGAMLYIVGDELLPSCNRYHKIFGYLGILVGFAVTMLVSL